jgi:hypothetical protein
MALAPIAIKLGLDLPFGRIQEMALCEECGRRASYTTGPSFAGMDVGWMQFPAATPSGNAQRAVLTRPSPLPASLRSCEARSMGGATPRPRLAPNQ